MPSIQGYGATRLRPASYKPGGVAFGQLTKPILTEVSERAPGGARPSDSRLQLPMRVPTQQLITLCACAPAWRTAMPLHRPVLPRQPSSFRSAPPLMQLEEPPAVVFEAQGDPLQAAILIGTIVIPFAYWWYITVPEARLNLAKDKRRPDGDTNAYLRDLAADEDANRPVERWFFSKWLRQLKPARAAQMEALPTLREEGEVAPLEPSVPEEPSARRAAAESDIPAPADSDVTLRELFTPASLSGNATPRFWSGDNPIVVTMGTLLTLGLFATAARENAALAVDGALLLAGLTFGLTRLGMK